MTPRALRVAFLTSARAWRGSGVSLAKLAAGLAARGHRPHVLAGSAVVRDAFGERGITASLIPAGRTGLREAWGLRRRLRALEAEIVVADKARDLRLAVLATLGADTHILYRYNHNPLELRFGLRTRLLFRRASGCIYQSERVRQEAVGRTPWLGRARSWVIPNGYDTSVFRPAPGAGREFRLRHTLAENAALILTVGALERDKGQEVAIAALSQMGPGRRSIYLLCGAGEGESRLRDLGERSRVTTLFLGYLQADTLVGAFNAADLVLHPSLEDIFPNAVGEAMACGRPVVATDVGGVGELVGRDGSAGSLVPPRDPAAMAKAIGELLADPRRRGAMGEAARRRVAAQFPLTIMVDRYEAVLQAIVAG